MVTATLEKKTIPRGNDYWHSTDQIFFTMGHGYGVDPEGNTIWLGTESDILSFLDGGIMPGNIQLPAISELYRIKEYQENILMEDFEENGRKAVGTRAASYRTSKLQRADNVRVRPMRHARYQRQDTRPVKARRTSTNNLPKPHQPGLQGLGSVELVG